MSNAKDDEDWYFRRTPVPEHPGWEITEVKLTTGAREVSVAVSRGAKNTIVQDVDYDMDSKDLIVSLDCPYEGTHGGRIPIDVLVSMLQKMGWGITPPTV